MKTSNYGKELIKKFEGCVLTTYFDCGGYVTIGYGHLLKNSEYVNTNISITLEQAEIFLDADILKAEKKVNKYMNIYNFNQNQYDALVSFAFNVGNIEQLTNYGRRTLEVIAEKMLLYCKCRGTELKGLKNRRKKERDLFLTPITVHEIVERELNDIKDNIPCWLIKDIINGKYGTGTERKKQILQLGFDYNIVQGYVNYFMFLNRGNKNE